MTNDRRPSPDGDPRPTGAGDPYLGNLAHEGQAAADQPPSVSPDNTGAWSSYDPYLVDIGRSVRSDF